MIAYLAAYHAEVCLLLELCDHYATCIGVMRSHNRPNICFFSWPKRLSLFAISRAIMRFECELCDCIIAAYLSFYDFLTSFLCFRVFMLMHSMDIVNHKTESDRWIWTGSSYDTLSGPRIDTEKFETQIEATIHSIFRLKFALPLTLVLSLLLSTTWNSRNLTKIQFWWFLFSLWRINSNASIHINMGETILPFTNRSR